ncbi:MAG: bifunctional folylpolyglutamate synthase/dihydrofolate synthase [Deltaproteobacteria bacterium]|nr:bifunctional folylpolyglutamate synthase/dihydrofolate synthase [Deltaproteobacteria bacterium]
MSIRSYEHALTYLLALEKKGIFLSVETTQKALKLLGNPQKKFPSVLVAGTNGKGSTVAMLSSILRQADYQVGTYISPHLLDVRERIQFNGKMIGKQELVSLVNELDQFLKKTKISLSFFEFMTVMGFLYYARKKVDFAVVEVGLGGRLDATNVLRPLVSVITSIDFDHQRLLGNTLSKIAYEKAGIIKPKGKVVTAVSQSKIQRQLQAVCRKRKAKLFILGRNFFIEPHFELSLAGKFHQRKNAACAIAVARLLREKGWGISEEAIQGGLKSTHWPGRLEVVRQKPLVMLDGAHNPAGIQVLLRSLKSDFQYRKLHMVMGVLADKNYKKMFKLVSSYADSLSYIELPVRRALRSDLLFKTLPYLKRKVRREYDIEAVLPKVIRQAHRDDLVCVTGSLYTVSEAKRLFL